MANPLQTCKSCSNEFSGSYCNLCGEKVVIEEDRKIKNFIGEFINALTFVDGKFWNTIKRLTLSPGTFSNDYTQGKRVNYMKPISVFFFANLLYFFFPWFATFNTSLQTQINSHTFFHRAIAERMVEAEVASYSISFEEYERAYNQKTTELSKLLLIAMAILLSLFLWLINFKKTSLLSDSFIVSLEFLSFILLYPIIIQSFLVRGLGFVGITFDNTEEVITTVLLLAGLFFSFKMEYTFFKVTGVKRLFNSVLSLAALTATIFLYRAFLFFVTFWSI